MSIPIKNWVPTPVSDSSDWMDRPMPTYDTSLRKAAPQSPTKAPTPSPTPTSSTDKKDKKAPDAG